MVISLSFTRNMPGSWLMSGENVRRIMHRIGGVVKIVSLYTNVFHHDGRLLRYCAGMIEVMELSLANERTFYGLFGGTECHIYPDDFRSWWVGLGGFPMGVVSTTPNRTLQKQEGDCFAIV
jgi:hypothetical protein